MKRRQVIWEKDGEEREKESSETRFRDQLPKSGFQENTSKENGAEKPIAYKFREAPVPNHQSPNPLHPSLQLMDNMEERDLSESG